MEYRKSTFFNLKEKILQFLPFNITFQAHIYWIVLHYFKVT